ncbi:MAG: hypothetical protein ACI4SL_06820, partial [Candidatus Ornithospirochaeta sp.]
MFGFYIKKAFFDGWDNFIQLVLQNIIYIILFLLIIGSVVVFGDNLGLFLPAAIVILFLFSLSMGGSSVVVYNWSDYKSETWRPYMKGVGRNIRHSMVFFLCLMVLLMLFFLVIPFYLSFDNIIGTILGVMMVWLSVFLLLVLPYYFPLMNLLPGDGPFKTLKKCFIIAGDNIGYTILLLLHNLVDIVLTVVTMGLLPGWCGVMLGGQDMMKLLMKKYDWIEENPDKNRKEMDWSEILYEEK